MTDALLPIRPAATLILLRDWPHSPRVLMGQRGSKAAFMPDKFVFPGGAVDADDAQVPLVTSLSAICTARLGMACTMGDRHPTPQAMVVAAIQELWEETGLILGQPGQWDAPVGWKGFAATGAAPSARGMVFFFRAITPPGAPRRFDARFFLADAAHLTGDLAG